MSGSRPRYPLASRSGTGGSNHAATDKPQGIGSGSKRPGLSDTQHKRMPVEDAMSVAPGKRSSDTRDGEVSNKRSKGTASDRRNSGGAAMSPASYEGIGRSGASTPNRIAPQAPSMLSSATGISAAGSSLSAQSAEHTARTSGQLKQIPHTGPLRVTAFAQAADRRQQSALGLDDSSKAQANPDTDAKLIALDIRVKNLLKQFEAKLSESEERYQKALAKKSTMLNASLAAKDELVSITQKVNRLSNSFDVEKVMSVLNQVTSVQQFQQKLEEAQILDKLGQLNGSQDKLLEEFRKADNRSHAVQRDASEALRVAKAAQSCANNLSEKIVAEGSTIDSRMVSAEEKLTRILSNTDEVTSRLGELEKTTLLAQTSTSVSKLQADLSSANSNIHRIKQEVAGDISAVEKNVSLLQAQASQTESAAKKSLDQVTKSLVARIEKLEKRTDKSTKETKSKVEDVASELTKKLFTIGERFASDTAQERLDLHATKDKVVKIESEIARIGTFDKWLPNLQKRLADLEARSIAKSSVPSTSAKTSQEEIQHMISQAVDLVRQDIENLRVAFQKDFPQLNDYVESVERDTFSQSHMLAKLDEQMSQMQPKIERTQATLAQHADNISKVDDKLQKFEIDTSNAKEAWASKFDRIEGILNVHTADISTINDRTPPATMAPSPAAITYEHPVIADLNTNMKHLAQVVQGLREDLNKSVSMVDDVQNQVGALRFAHSDLESRYNNISTDKLYRQMVHWFQDDYPAAPALHTRITALETQIKSLQGHVQRSASTPADVREMKTKLNEQQTQVQVLKAAIDGCVQRATSHDSTQDLRREVSNLIKKTDSDRSRTNEIFDNQSHRVGLLENELEPLQQLVRNFEVMIKSAVKQDVVDDLRNQLNLFKEQIEPLPRMIDSLEMLRADRQKLGQALMESALLKHRVKQCQVYINSINLSLEKPLQGIDFDDADAELPP